MITSIDLNIRLSLFALSGYQITTLDKYDMEPDIKIVAKQGIQRAFCTFCGSEVENFDPQFQGMYNHDHYCQSFQKYFDEHLS
ncbi:MULTISPECIES: hypothetical protein [Acinetobacter]|uniref:hypothetical protein n=1 Tax=Acinetobacter TaxID=469 RepID=UPI00028C13DA|nr:MULTISPECIES: hypothetical protein [Acinetobacter]MDP7849510.1 hypothetical protein [Acinetobacter baumannii]BBL22330.1 hypothetical protein ACRAD_30010 [Acinetobacter radioresistens DSM 6976 = NBRC 102413 = CIP 103788]